MSQPNPASQGEGRKLACPSCGTKITIKPPHAGKKAKCPGCAVVLLVSPQLDRLSVVGTAPAAGAAPSKPAASASKPTAPVAKAPPGRPAQPAVKTRPGAAPAAGGANPQARPARKQAAALEDTVDFDPGLVSSSTPGAAAQDPLAGFGESGPSSVSARGRGKESSKGKPKGATKAKEKPQPAGEPGKKKPVPIVVTLGVGIALLGAIGWVAMTYLSRTSETEKAAASQKKATQRPGAAKALDNALSNSPFNQAGKQAPGGGFGSAETTGGIPGASGSATPGATDTATPGATGTATPAGTGKAKPGKTGSTGKPAAGPPRTPIDFSKLPLQFLPDNAEFIVVAHPKAMLTGEAGQAFLTRFPDLADQSRGQMSGGFQNPEEIELIFAGLNGELGDEGKVILIRRDRALQLADFFAEFELPELKAEQFGGYTISSTSPGHAVCLLDDNTGLLGGSQTIQQILQRGGPPKLSPALQKSVAAIKPTAHFSIVALPDPAKLQQNPLAQSAPPQIQQFVQSVRQATFDLSIEQEISAQIAIACKDAAAAEGLNTMIGGLLALGKLQLGDKNAPPPAKIAAEILENLQIAQAGDTVTGNLKFPLEMAFTALEAAQQSAGPGPNQIAIDLANIAVAIHNYHDVMRRLPAAAGGKKPNTGLSWRVAILPFIEEQQLFDKFHHDEPWDSEHNRPLVAEMPAIYGPNDGTNSTRIVTFRHESSAFPGETTLGLSGVSDGSSRTLMVVQASPESAVIWTKPDDLPFDPAIPKAGLDSGDGSFWAVFVDGHRQHISLDIPDKLLNAMVTRAGMEEITSEELDSANVPAE